MTEMPRSVSPREIWCVSINATRFADPVGLPHLARWQRLYSNLWPQTPRTWRRGNLVQLNLHATDDLIHFNPDFECWVLSRLLVICVALRLASALIPPILPSFFFYIKTTPILLSCTREVSKIRSSTNMEKKKKN